MAEDETTTADEAVTGTGAPEATVSEAPATTETPAPPAEPQEVLAPKERRARARAARAAKAKPGAPRSAQERHADRQVVRAAKASERRAGRAKAKAKARATAVETVPTAPRDRVVGVQKLRQGVVVSDRADKTITVRIDMARRHRRYSKIVRTSETLHAHDESNDAHIGDTVTVREARPLSRTKRWRLVGVIERAR